MAKARPHKTHGQRQLQPHDGRTRAAAVQPPVPAQQDGTQEWADPQLVRFDRETVAFLAGLALILVLATAFKLQGSSVAMWNQILRNPAGTGVVVGTPKSIRVDEWAFSTTMLINQARLRPPFPVDNPVLGRGPVTLITSLPVRHWSVWLRPTTWGYFFLDVERGFAFSWNLQTYALLTGVFLLLMVLTSNDFTVSLIGTAWVFFSGFTQWWYSIGVPAVIGATALLIVAVHYLTLSTSRWAVAVWGMLFVASAMNFALAFYPPFQVPLVYLGIVVSVGSLAPALQRGIWKRDLRFRGICVVLVLLLTASVFVLYHRDAAPAIDAMRRTVYPGARQVTGGDMTVARLFGGFFGFFMSEEHVPQGWLNVCEASNFVLLFPIPMAVAFWRAGRRLRVTPIEWTLIGYLVIESAWMVVGFPRTVSSLSGFGMSQPVRSQIGVGLASILLCCVFLAKARNDVPTNFTRKALVVLAMFALFIIYGLDFNRVTTGFATSAQILIVSIAATAAAYSLLIRAKGLFALCLLVPLVSSYALVNPVAYGLGPIIDTKVVREVSRVVDQDPGARWIVYGSYFAADLLKTTGAHVFLGGTKGVPPLEELKVLDPDSSSVSVYNRFAHVTLNPARENKVTFTLVGEDRYTLEVDPKSQVWRELGVKYVAMPAPSTDAEFLAQTAPVPDVTIGLWIYKFKG